MRGLIILGCLMMCACNPSDVPLPNAPKVPKTYFKAIPVSYNPSQVASRWLEQPEGVSTPPVTPMPAEPKLLPDLLTKQDEPTVEVSGYVLPSTDQDRIIGGAALEIRIKN